MLFVQQINSDLIDLALTAEVPPQKLVVAFSGGLDSSVLLHLVKNWHRTHSHIEIQALHVNHQLQPDADQWQQHCQQLCQQWNIPFQAARAVVDTAQASLEQAAREARYRVFEEHLKPNQWLLLAHHRDDQAETLLQRLARGSGPLGLGAMTPLSQRRSMTLVRPLLECDRQQLEHYARCHDLLWVEDPSNQSDQHERNFLRNQVLPLWRQNRPQLNVALARSARLCQESVQLLDDLAAVDLGDPREDGGLAVACLTNLTPVRQHNLLRYWIRRQDRSLPSEAVLSRIIPEVVLAQKDAQPQMEWGEVMLRRFKGVLYVLPCGIAQLPAFESSLSNTILSGGVVDFSYGQLGFLATKQPSYESLSLGVQACSSQPLRVGGYRAGEAARPLGRPSKQIKRWLQDYQVPPWLRHLWPVLYCGDRVAAVPGLFVCQDFQPQGGSDSVQLSWQWRLG